MENQFKYLNYIVQNSDYYQKKGNSAHSEFEAPNLNNNWSVNKDDNFWTMCFVPSSTMIEQGFKIHISTKYEHANETLCLVSKFLSELNIAFKYVKSQEALYSMYSKNGSRISAGKFITIYPNEQEFIPLLHQLEKVLDGQPKGPYILTDKRWKNTNIYYRYGGFQTLKNQAGDYCIKGPNGGLIPDKREAKFQLPNFIELPKELKEQDERSIVNNEHERSKLNLFTIEKVIRFSNAGGIYQAVRKSDNKKCIIKEARSEIGLDGQGKNAMYRLEAEYNALSQLRNVKGIMQVIDYFQVWEHKFLVVEFIEGNSLYSWVSLNYPFSYKIDVKEYCEKVKKVIELLKCIVEQMHEKGIAMCDLQHQNIIIDDDLNITIIDFETSEDAYAESQPSMATRGFSNLKNTIAKDRDWYSLNRILHFLLLPIGPSYDLDIYNNIKHCLWIRNTFGDEMYKYYYNFQMNTGKNITNFNDIFLDTYSISKDKVDSNEFHHNLNIDLLLEKLQKSLLSNCNSESKSFINGDIRQHEMDCGILNVQNGGFGAILALYRLNLLNDNAKQWVFKQIPNLLSHKYNNGFLTGRSGIACTLYECGFKEEAVKLMELVINDYVIESKDFSLRSGLSGIGIALCCIGSQTKNNEYILKAKEIAEVLFDKIQNNQESVGTDWQSYNIGLIDGYAGISLFFTLLYKITKNEKYLSYSEFALDREIAKGIYSNEDGSFRLLDAKTNQMYPYLSNGSAGLGIAISALNNTNKIFCFNEELIAIIKSIDYRVTLEPNLFDGISGFLLIDCLSQDDELTEKIIDALSLFLVEAADTYAIPGKMFYKLSSDIHTGSAGVILALICKKAKNPLLWLPMIGSFLR